MKYIIFIGVFIIYLVGIGTQIILLLCSLDENKEFEKSLHYIRKALRYILRSFSCTYITFREKIDILLDLLGLLLYLLKMAMEIIIEIILKAPIVTINLIIGIIQERLI